MRILSLLFAVIALSSCNVNSYIMLKDGKDTEYSIPPTEQTEYRIAPNDQLTFRFYKNNGFDILGGSTMDASQGQIQQLSATNIYNVEIDGKIKLPYLGKVPLGGMTLREAETHLEDLYDEIYVNPFIILNVLNRRVIVSTGDGASVVVPLLNNNTSVFEALSIAGGINPRGRANKIKVIRRVLGGHELYKLDLSTVDGLALADMPVQANDIIYVDPRKNLAGELVKEIGPYLALLSSALLIYTLSIGK